MNTNRPLKLRPNIPVITRIELNDPRRVVADKTARGIGTMLIVWLVLNIAIIAWAFSSKPDGKWYYAPNTPDQATPRGTAATSQHHE